MAKDTIPSYSATASSNTDVGGVGIVGTNAISNADDALREIMSHLKEMSAGTNPVEDTMTFGDPADLTKRYRFDAGSVTAGQTRVYTVPDANGTMMISGSYPTAVSLEGLTLGAGDMLYATAADTLADLAIGTAGQFLVVNAGATAPEWASRPTLVSLEGLSLAAGDILYATAADTLARLAKGTAAQQLAMNAGATAPEWVTPVTTGYTLLGTITTTSGSSQALTSLTLTGYKFLRCVLNGVSLNGSGDILQNSQVIGNAPFGSGLISGILEIDLTSGAAWFATGGTSNTSDTVGGHASGLTTASTAITFTTSATFDAGSIRVYGVL